MLKLALWPILAVWAGLAFVVLAAIVAVLGWSTGLVLKDVAKGDEGDLWCPVHKKMMHVSGVPRRSNVDAPFTHLRTCDNWEDGKVRCQQTCLLMKLPGTRAAA